MDRRAIVFAALALVCFTLAPVGLEEHRYLAIAVGGVYVVLALLSMLDARSKASQRRARRRADR